MLFRRDRNNVICSYSSFAVTVIIAVLTCGCIKKENPQLSSDQDRNHAETAHIDNVDTSIQIKADEVSKSMQSLIKEITGDCENPVDGRVYRFSIKDYWVCNRAFVYSIDFTRGKAIAQHLLI